MPGPYERVAGGQIVRAEHVNKLQQGLEEVDISIGPGDEGDIKATVGGVVVNSRHQAHGGITVAASDSPQWLKDMADFHPGMSGSDSAHLQAAIDQAQASVSDPNSTPVPSVILQPGVHHWDSSITAKSAPLLSQGSDVTVVWDGLDDVAAIVNDDSYPGGLMRMQVVGFTFEEGDGIPLAWLDLRGGSFGPDSQMRVARNVFRGGKYQWLMDNFTNGHFRHNRFDGWREYALSFAPSATAYLGNFLVSDFTCDNTNHDAPFDIDLSAKGFMRITLPENGVDCGSITLEHGRIELTIDEEMRDPKALVHVIQPAANDTGTFTLLGRSLDIQAPDLDCLVYQESADHHPLWPISIDIDHKCSKGALPTHGGDLVGEAPVITTGTKGRVAVGRPETVSQSPSSYHSVDWSDPVIRSYAYESASVPMWETTARGRTTAGNTSTLDTTWGRYAADTFGVADDDVIRPGRGETASRPNATTVGAGGLWYDTDIDALIASTGAVWQAVGAAPSDTGGLVSVEAVRASGTYTDDAVLIADAVDAAITGGFAGIHLGPVAYVLKSYAASDAGIDIDDVPHFRIVGSGVGATSITWDDSLTSGSTRMIRIQDATTVEVSHLELDGNKQRLADQSQVGVTENEGINCKGASTTGRVWLHHLYLHDFGQDAIDTDNADQVLIDHVIAEDNGGCAAHVSGNGNGREVIVSNSISKRNGIERYLNNDATPTVKQDACGWDIVGAYTNVILATLLSVDDVRGVHIRDMTRGLVSNVIIDNPGYSSTGLAAMYCDGSGAYTLQATNLVMRSGRGGSAAGLLLTNGDRLQFANVIANGFAWPIRLNGCGNADFSGLYLDVLGGGYGAFVESAASGAYLRFDGGRVIGGSNAFRLLGGSGEIRNFYISGQTTVGVDIREDTSVGWSVTNNKARNQTGAAVRLFNDPEDCVVAWNDFLGLTSPISESGSGHYIGQNIGDDLVPA